jgi:starch synthase
MGSWVLNYVQALQTAGVSPVLFCVTAQVFSITRLIHRPTGVAIVALPLPKIYQLAKWSHRKHLDGATVHPRSAVPGGLIGRVNKATMLFVKWYLSTPIFALFREVHRDGCQSLLVQEYESVRFDLCALMGRLKRIPVFGTFTGAHAGKRWTRPLRSIALRLSAGLLICARREADRVVADYSLPASKLGLVYYPLDFSVWHPEDKEKARASLEISSRARVAIYHGAIEMAVKGLDVLVEAWQEVCRDRPDRDLRLIIVGTGADSPAMTDLIITKQLRGVEWLNEWVQDRTLLRRYLSAADVYVFPSRDDAFGIAVLEAMACGLPVVAANARGVADIFEDADCSGALIVPPGDAQALSGAIGRVLDDPALARELGERAQRRVKTAFSMEVVGKQLSAFLLRGRP